MPNCWQESNYRRILDLTFLLIIGTIIACARTLRRAGEKKIKRGLPWQSRSSECSILNRCLLHLTFLLLLSQILHYRMYGKLRKVNRFLCSQLVHNKLHASGPPIQKTNRKYITSKKLHQKWKISQSRVRERETENFLFSFSLSHLFIAKLINIQGYSTIACTPFFLNMTIRKT